MMEISPTKDVYLPQKVRVLHIRIPIFKKEHGPIHSDRSWRVYKPEIFDTKSKSPAKPSNHIRQV